MSIADSRYVCKERYAVVCKGMLQSNIEICNCAGERCVYIKRDLFVCKEMQQ